MGLTQEEKEERLIATKDIVCIDPNKDNSEFVFISYKSDDWKIAINDVVRKLQKTYGLRIYFDGDFDKHDSSWVEHMQNAISSGGCVAVLAFVSKKYTTSYACLMELLMTCHPDAMFMRFDNTSVPIIPVIIDDSADLKGTITRSVEKVHITEWGPYNDMLIRIKEDERVYSENRNFRAVIDDLMALKNNVTLGRISAAFYRLLLESQLKFYTGQPEQLELIYSTIKNRSEYAFDESLKGDVVWQEEELPGTVNEEASPEEVAAEDGPETVVCEEEPVQEEIKEKESGPVVKVKTLDDYIAEAERGDKAAESYLVQVLQEEGSIKVCKALARIGNVEAQLELARLHVHGSLGIKKDVRESVRWYCEAHKGGCAEAKEALLQLLEKQDSDELYELAENFGMELDSRMSKRERVLLEKAQAGELKAYVELGDMYLQADGVKQDIAVAVAYYVTAQDLEYTYADAAIKNNIKKYGAEKEYAQAWALKGNECLEERMLHKAEKCYLKAISFCPLDDVFVKMAEVEHQKGSGYRTVLSWYEKVSDEGKKEADKERRRHIYLYWAEIVVKKDLQLLINEVDALCKEDDYKEAFKWCIRLGKDGHKASVEKAAQMRKKGLISELSDEDERVLAEYGVPGSYYRLGMRYLTGDDIRQDYVMARKCFEKDEYYGNARLELGDIYRLGLGVKVDKEKAMQYYMPLIYDTLHHKRRENPPERILQLMAEREWADLYGKVVLYRTAEWDIYSESEKTRQEAMADYTEAASWGYEEACFVLASVAEKEGKLETAKSWYQKVNGKRVIAARNELARIETLLEKEFLKEFPDTSTAESKIALAKMYLYGEHVKQDFEQARSWFEQAYAQGSDEALLYLGALYADGKGVKKDIKRAASYFCAAERAGVEECDVFMGPYKHVAAFRKLCADIYFEKAMELGLKEGEADFERAASYGHRDAYLELARLYEALNTPEGDAKALELYEKARDENGHNTRADISAIKTRQEQRIKAQKEKEQPKVQISATVESYYKQAVMFMKSSPALADAYLEKAANGGHPEAIKLLEERKPKKVDRPASVKPAPIKKTPVKPAEKNTEVPKKAPAAAQKQSPTKADSQNKSKRTDIPRSIPVNTLAEVDFSDNLSDDLFEDFDLLDFEPLEETPKLSHPQKASIEDTEGMSYYERVFYYKKDFDDVDAKYQRTGRGIEELMDACYCYALILSKENDMSGLAVNIWKYLLRLVEEYEKSGEKSVYTKAEIHISIAELYEGEKLDDRIKAWEYREKARKEK